MKQYIYKFIAIAGTFDRLHKGHRHFILQAFNLGQRIIIGLTSDTYVEEKIKDQRSKIKVNVNNFEGRKKELEEFLKEENLLNRSEIVKIDDIYGPTCRQAGNREDNGIEALVVTAETMEGANKVNKKRKEMGFSPLEILKVPLIFADDEVKIASTRIRIGEIDRWGKAFAQQMQLSNFQFTISNELRNKLKKPLGKLIRGNSQDLHEIADILKEAVGKTNAGMISTVGDEVTKLCNRIGIPINLAIIDYKVRREKKYNSISDLGFRSTFARGTLAKGLVTVRNPAGHITKELVNAVKDAYLGIIKDGRQRIIEVDGEEDLAGIPAVLLAPLGTVVLYGQPGEGVVVVEVTEEKKQKLLRLTKL